MLRPKQTRSSPKGFAGVCSMGRSTTGELKKKDNQSFLPLCFTTFRDYTWSVVDPGSFTSYLIYSRGKNDTTAWEPGSQARSDLADFLLFCLIFFGFSLGFWRYRMEEYGVKGVP